MEKNSDRRRDLDEIKRRLESICYDVEFADNICAGTDNVGPMLRDPIDTTTKKGKTTSSRGRDIKANPESPQDEGQGDKK